MTVPLRLNFSHLNEHKFRHNFLGTINPLCSCGSESATGETPETGEIGPHGNTINFVTTKTKKMY